MLFELKDNQLIIDLWQKYLNTIDLHLEKNIDKYKVNIISGLKIPSSFKILNSFLSQIQYLIKQYSENHSIQRKEKKVSNGIEIENFKSDFIEKETSIIEEGTKIIQKFELIQFINTNELYKMLLEDYLLLFCYRKFKQRTESEINQTKITIDGYNQYMNAVETDPTAKVIDSGSKDGITYTFYSVNDSEFNYIIKIDGSNTGILLGNPNSQAEAEEVFSRMTFSQE